MDDLTIGDIGIEDAADLSRLHVAAFSPLGQETWTARAFRDLLRLGGVGGLAARRPGGDMAAFLLLQISGAEAEILSLATDPAWRRRGIARRLLMTVIHDYSVTGGRRLVLEVRADNAAALALYRDAGFRKVGERPNYYRDRRIEERLPALILAKELETPRKSPA